jgi:hypothetical protein
MFGMGAEASTIVRAEDILTWDIEENIGALETEVTGE